MRSHVALLPRALRWNCLLALVFSIVHQSHAGWIWVEGESPNVNKMNRHPWWYDQVKRNQLSGGDFISNFNAEKPGEAEYHFTATNAGQYEFWVRANPLNSKLSYSLNGAPDTLIDLNREKRGEINIAADSKPDLRFIAWSKVGTVALKQGENTIRFRMHSENSNHGYLDCFVFSTEPFEPRGILRPDQRAEESDDEKGWFAFDPTPDTFADQSAIDLRWLNEKFAGQNGFISVKDGQFVHSGNGQPIRFWAVNGPPHDLSGPELARCARILAKYGVNMVRIHGGYFNEQGEVDMARVRHAFEIVQAMKAEGIYTHFSIYFPLWITPKPGTPWLRGYDGKTHPFAALLFNPDFQAQYQKWWTALLTTPDPVTGKPLVAEPAVASVELQNEDSFFFWTFNTDSIPDEEARMLEKMFGDWLIKKYGSLEGAFAKWNGPKVKRDAPAEGRVGFRPLWNMSHEKTMRDQDSIRFLFELQAKFYADTKQFLRKLGFVGLITASNWTTADPETLGPLEKLSYTTCDFLDRHGYLSCGTKGEGADWSIRNGHTYSDRSGLRFDAEDLSKPKVFVHPSMDPHYDGKPSMISEIAWNRPNRYRSEAPLYLACYGALQHSDAIVHFAYDGDRWSVKPGYFMQPWTMMSPATVGQFPAAALIYRQGLISAGDVLAEVNLNPEQLLQLQGTPLPQDAALDELRLKDIPSGTKIEPGQRIDPLIHYAGRVNVLFTNVPGSVKMRDLAPLINHLSQTVKSSTGELQLDYGKGLLVIDAAQAQGISGNLKAADAIQTKDLTIKSELEIGHIVAVALDNQPLATSKKILLQIMSEDKTTGFKTEPVSTNVKRIVEIGTDPWMVRDFIGTVSFKRPDARLLKVAALDFNGGLTGPAGTANAIQLKSSVVYYVITGQ